MDSYCLHVLYVERLLAAQNPLSKASLPHQLFADAPVAQANRQQVIPIRAPMSAGKRIIPACLSIVFQSTHLRVHIHAYYPCSCIYCPASTAMPPMMQSIVPPPAPPGPVPPQSQPPMPTEIPRPMQFPPGMQLPPGIRPPPGHFTLMFSVCAIIESFC